MNTTKTCSHCQSEISALAKKCPQCKSDLRIWFARHPILTAFLIIFVGIPFMGGIIGLFTAKSDPSDTSTKVATNTYVQVYQESRALESRRIG